MAEEEHDEHEAPPSTGWGDFPEEEERVIQFWRDCNAFQTSYELSVKEGRPAYVFYDGPPFATVLLHTRLRPFLSTFRTMLIC
jgi:isoleucyl-tRNA synthetase